MRLQPAARRDSTTLDVGVLDGGERQSLVAVRSLGRAGLRVGAFGHGRWSPALASRWCTETGRLPDSSADPQRFADALTRMIAEREPRAVITAHDGTIEILRAHRRELERRTRIALAPEPALEIAVDKERTLAAAAALGVGIPRTEHIERLDDLDDAIAEVGAPAVVKPVRSWVDGAGGGERLQSAVVTDLGEARTVAGRALAVGGSVVLQELLSGSREAVSLLLVEGRVRATFAQVAHRMYPPLGGSSVVRESIAAPADLLDPAVALVTEIGLEGYSEVEFRRDAHGRPYLMEINPRLSASVEVAVRSGVDFPLLLHAWATGSPLPRVGGYRTGVRMRWLGGDIRWLRDTLAQQGRPETLPAGRAVTDFVLDSFRPAAYDYVTFADLRPALVAACGFTVRAAKTRGHRQSQAPHLDAPST
jgi:predicted ATP-grasp superfamily ATP-dependent carboligase